jgi:hypothetical protein
MVALPVSLNGTATVSETGFVTVNFTDGDGRNVEFAATPSVTITPEAQEVNVEKQRYQFEPVKLGSEITNKLDALRNVKLELPKLRTSPAKDYLKKTSPISSLPQLDVNQIAKLLPDLDFPKLDIDKLKNQISVQSISDMSLPKMTIKQRTSNREAIKKKAADKLGDWTFSKKFSISRWDKTLSFNLNGYRDKVASAVSYAGVTIVGIVDGKLGKMFDDEFKDYMNDNIADELNPKIEGLSGAIEDAANAVIKFINDKVIAKYNKILKDLSAELYTMLDGHSDALRGIVGVDKNRDGIPDTGINAMMRSNIRLMNNTFNVYGKILFSETERIKETFNGAFGGLETGMNTIIEDIEKSVNGKFALIGEALQTTLDEINEQINKALTMSGANLYANLNLPTNIGIAPAPVRNITTSSFQFFSNGTKESPQTVHWVAVGMAQRSATGEMPTGATPSPARGGVFGDLLDKFT